MLILTLLAPTADAMLEEARAARALFSHQPPGRGVACELRLDRLADPRTGIALIERLPRPVIATCRRPREGGAWRGSEPERRELLAQAAQLADWVDVEWPDAASWRFSGRARRLLSYHGLGDASLRPEEIAERMAREDADARKIAVSADNLAGLARVLHAQRDYRDAATVFAIGDLGQLSRWTLLAPRASPEALVYVAAGARPAAPGQMTAAEVALAQVQGAAAGPEWFLGVLGDPVSMSLSPATFNGPRLAARGGRYLRFESRNVTGLADFMRAGCVRGLSVTAPHKVAVMSHLDAIDATAAAIGAVNTVIVERDGSLGGHNTDWIGVREPFARRLATGGSGKGARALIVGAGGAARAAVAGLASLGCEVTVAARRRAASEALARSLGCGATSLEEIAARGERFDCVVDATPAGGPAQPGAQAVPDCAFGPGSIVLDMSYRPLVTPLVERARGRGAHAILGLEMFAVQAREQWKLFLRDDAAAVDEADAVEAAAWAAGGARRPGDA
jgi:3-dehydroquinate dehydratase / shikimate dehydrogenase